MNIGGQTETDKLRRVLMKHPRDAFRSRKYIQSQWKSLNYLSPPDFDRAVQEYDALIRIIGDSGAEVDFLPLDERTGMDSIYTRDAALLTDRGLILCRMGKDGRMAEPEATGKYLEEQGIPVLGAIEHPGRLEGGDVTWLDSRSLAVGQGYRTNADGIRQLTILLQDKGVEVITVPLPHWNGPEEVLHLMSMISPVASTKALVYSRMMPVPFREILINRGWDLIEVPDQEYETMAGNVLCLGSNKCLMLEGNPETRKKLERAGIELSVYGGNEISLKGSGGPTCLTRPLLRSG